MSEQTVEPVRLSPSELRTLFLFEHLDDEQLAWLSENGYCESWLGGQNVYTEGSRRPASMSCCRGRCRCIAGWRTLR